MRAALLPIWLLAVQASAALAVDAPAADAPAVDTIFTHPATPPQLQALLGESVQALRSAQVVRGEFSQRKLLHDLPQPLLSSGEFLAARGVGVDWHTRVPFDSDLVLTAQAVAQRDGTAGRLQLIASNQAGLSGVAQVFEALFALDLPRLAEHFELFGARSEEAWTLGLKPRDAAVAKVLDAVVVSGDRQPLRIVLNEAGGDRTEITLSRQSLSATLSEADRQRFK